MRMATKITRAREGYRWLSRKRATTFLTVVSAVALFSLASISRSFVKVQIETLSDVKTDDALTRAVILPSTSQKGTAPAVSTTSLLRKTTIVAAPTTNKSTPPTNTTVEYKWINYDQIFRGVIDELETTGWKAPTVMIGPAIKKIKLPKSASKKSRTTLPAVPKEDVLAVAERWKIVNAGCFYESKTTSALITADKVMVTPSFMTCITNCAMRNKRYASISAGNQCQCGVRISSTGSLQPRYNECNQQCRDDKTRTCGGKTAASVYRIAKHVHETMTKESVRQSSAGCFENPPTFSSTFRSIAHGANAAECIIECEKKKFVTAARDNDGVCSCGSFTERFPFRGLGTRVNDSFCDNPCPRRTPSCRHKYIRVTRTLSEDPRCDSRKLLPKTVGRLVALISFPGSGNTWVRHLIETATGIYTGSVYGDMTLFSDGFIGEKLAWNSRMTSVIKTHFYTEKSAGMYQEAVLVVRNPYDAMLAEMNRIRGGHVGYAELQIYDTIEWLYYLGFNSMKWFITLESFAEKDKLLVVYYEDIVENPVREVRKIAAFLQYPVDNLEERLQCLESNLSGDFKRKKRKLNFDPFPQKYKDMINLYIKTARRMFASKFLPPVPEYER